MSTLHEVEASEATGTLRERKSFYAAVGLKGLFRRSTSKGSLVQAEANRAAGSTGDGGEARPGSASLEVPGAEGGNDTPKSGWGLFKWKR